MLENPPSGRTDIFSTFYVFIYYLQSFLLLSVFIKRNYFFFCILTIPFYFMVFVFILDYSILLLVEGGRLSNTDSYQVNTE
jgi:hypothetical protein